MIEALNRIGVRPQERRAAILLLLGLLVVGNVVWLFIGPELLKLQASRKDFEEKNKAMATLPDLVEKLDNDVKTLTAETGDVTDGRHAQQLMREIDSKARRMNLNFTKSTGQQGSSSRKKNQDFEEVQRAVTFQSDLIDLVGFLKKISEGKSMIRVSKMVIKPTPERKNLNVDLTFVASYPKPDTDSKSKKSKKDNK